jgi:uncharacterized protein YdeI (BOF family)
MLAAGGAGDWISALIFKMRPPLVRAYSKMSLSRKPESRIPEARKKAEGRRPKNQAHDASIRVSDFGLLSGFGFRASGFVKLLCLAPLILAISGCHKPHGTILGHAPKGQLSSILAVRAGDTPPHVTVSGVMIEKCPVAGCWLRVRDRTGIIKVDTKSAGFVVVTVPLDSQVTVAGKIVMDGDEAVLEAEGLRY